MFAHRRSLRAGAAIATGALLGSVLIVPVASAAPTGSSSGISFTSTPITSSIVAHGTVAASARSAGANAATSKGDVQDQLPDLSPKAYLAGPKGLARTAPVRTSVTTVGSGTGGTPRATRSFIGQQGSNVTCSYFASGCNPPDMAVAASPSYVLQGVNTQWEVLDTSGRVLSGFPVSAQSFFGVPSQPCDPASGNQPFLSDPRAFYDPTDHRFWAAMLQVEGGLGIAPGCPLLTLYWVAVSQTSDPTGAWNVYAFEMAHGTPFAADYTQIGLNSNTLFFSANMFGVAGGFYAEIFEANKAKMEQGRADFTVDGFANLQGTGPGTAIANVGPFLADTVQPVFTLGEGTRDGLFVDTVDGPDLLNGHLCSDPSTDACKGLIEWRMHNPTGHDNGGAAPTLTARYLPDTKSFAFPPPADEPTCTYCVDASDLRISATPVYSDGTIYAGWDSAIDNGTQVVPGIVWAEVSEAGGGRPSVQSGYFVLPGDQAATYPAFMPNADGQVVMLYEHMSSSTNPEAKYVVHDAGGPFTGAGRVLKAGEASYRPTLCGSSALPVCRWGDYEAVSFDGRGRIWLAGEYANSHTDPAIAPWYGRNWGTWIGAIGTGG